MQIGGLGNDTLIAGTGNDTFVATEGTDQILLSGEWGTDSVLASASGTFIQVTDAAAINFNSVPDGNDIVVNISGRLSTLRLTNFIGNEGNFIVQDQNGDIVNIGGTGTTQATALNISADTSVTARVGDVSNPDDYYTFTAPTDGQSTVTISGAAPGAVVQFLNSAGGIIDTATTDANGDATVTFSNAVRSETYAISVSVSADTAYSLDVAFSAQNFADSVSNPVNVNLPLFLESVTLDVTSNPVDAYRIVAPDDATLVVNTSLVTGGLDLRVYDSAGNLLKESATSGTVAEGLTLEVTQG